VLSVVRTTAWGLGAEEDVWQVEVPAVATVADLKAKIEELYEVPRDMQSLTLSGGEPSSEAPTLEDTVKAETLEGKRVYMNPSREALAGEEAIAGMAEMMMGAVQEMVQMDAAMVESLQGVMYKVWFERPADAGGVAAGKRIQLELDPLSLMSDVQRMVELELFGEAGKEPAFMVVNGTSVPPDISLFHARVEDGMTVIVAKERPPLTEEEMILQGLVGGDPSILAALNDAPTAVN